MFLYVFNAINRILALSPAITKALASLPHLLEKLAAQLNYIESQLSSSLLGGHRHHKNSESARSISEMVANGEGNMNTLEAPW